MKKFNQSLLVLGMLVISSSNILAAPVVNLTNVSEAPQNVMAVTIDLSNIEHGKTVILPDGSVLTPISQEQYVQELAREKSITLEEAYKLDQSMEQRAGNTYRYHYSKTFKYSKNTNFKSDLEATIKCWTDGRYTQINEVLSVSSRASEGLYDYDWIETAAFADSNQGYPCGLVTLCAKGYFDVRVSNSVGVDFDIPGFSMSGSSSSNLIYRSSTMIMEGTYKTY